MSFTSNLKHAVAEKFYFKYFAEVALLVNLILAGERKGWILMSTNT